MKQAFVLVICAVFVNCKEPVPEEIYFPCDTPDSKLGVCVSVRKCPAFLEALWTASEEEIRFMNESICGWIEPFHPKVCCGPDTFFKAKPRIPEVNSIRIEDLLPNRTQCGFEEDADKIMGGVNARITEFPWSALLKYVDYYGDAVYRCGGALISNRYILTAAHCLEEGVTSVRLGELNLNKSPFCTSTTRPQRICNDPFEVEVDHVIPHPKYNKLQYHNDIALIRLKHPVKFTKFVQPICLPKDSSERSKPGNQLWMAGWGVTADNSMEYSSIKQMIELPVISLKACQKRFRKKRVAATVLESHICAGGIGNKGTCSGDSGGALAANVFGRAQYYVEGILSFAASKNPYNTCAKETPAVFVRVSDYLDWIKENVKP